MLLLTLPKYLWGLAHAVSGAASNAQVSPSASSQKARTHMQARSIGLRSHQVHGTEPGLGGAALAQRGADAIRVVPNMALVAHSHALVKAWARGDETMMAQGGCREDGTTYRLHL